MQQDNNLTNKLQQLENQQLPDLSQMDKHWEQMRADLQSTATKPARSFPKRGIWFIAAVCIIALMFLAKNQLSKKEQILTTPANKQKEIIPVQIQPGDTNIVKAIVRTTLIPVPLKSKKPFIAKNNIFPVPANNATNIPGPVVKPANNTNPSFGPGDNADQTAVVNSLFTQLKKTTQEFVIDNSKDTLLECAEGAGLLIISNSLGGGQVTINIKEFYKRSDIVLNKLSTSSNGIRLESGGMLHITATKDGRLIQKTIGKPIKFYLADTSATIQGMQLFTGEEIKSGALHVEPGDSVASIIFYDGVNWIAQPQYFRNVQTVTEVRVLDLRNEPFKTIKRRKGTIGVFNIVLHPELSRAQVKKVLKEKYGYYKVRFGFRENSFFHGRLSSKIDSITYSDTPVGDSVWMLKAKADKYGLASTASRTYEVSRMQAITDGRWSTTINSDMLNKIEERYSVNITSLGWINCDRFSNDMRQKINYVIDLNDRASNFYTVLVFDKMRSIITGMVSGEKVVFANMPLGEKVKVISIGINKNGQPVMVMKEAIISKEMLGGLQFESSSAPAIKASLSKMD